MEGREHEIGVPTSPLPRACGLKTYPTAQADQSGCPPLAKPSKTNPVKQQAPITVSRRHILLIGAWFLETNTRKGDCG